MIIKKRLDIWGVAVEIKMPHENLAPYTSLCEDRLTTTAMQGWDSSGSLTIGSDQLIWILIAKMIAIAIEDGRMVTGVPVCGVRPAQAAQSYLEKVYQVLDVATVKRRFTWTKIFVNQITHKLKKNYTIKRGLVKLKNKKAVWTPETTKVK